MQPWAFKSSEIMVVVVVLPSLPVTAIILHGQSLKNTSISEVTTAPFGDSFGQVLVKRHQARGAENDITVEVLKIAVAERKLCSERK